MNSCPDSGVTRTPLVMLFPSPWSNAVRIVFRIDNLNQTWYTHNPDFTFCFHNTVLVWFPCFYLWLVALPAFYFLLRKKADKHQTTIPLNLLNSTKLIILVILTVLCIADLLYLATNLPDEFIVYPVHYVTPIIKFFTFMLALLIMELERRKGVRSSGVLFLFWLFLTVAGSGAYRAHLQGATDPQDQEENEYYFISYMIYYPLVFAQFLFGFLVDRSPPSRRKATDENKSPEESSSFPSHLIFAWFDKLIWTGYRKPLQIKDLWNLPSRMKCEMVVPYFLRFWNKEQGKFLRSANTFIIAPGRKASYQVQTGELAFTRMTKPGQASLALALWKAYGGRYCASIFLKLISDLFVFVSPIILREMIDFVTNKDDPVWRGYFFAGSLFICALCQSLLLQQAAIIAYEVGFRVRSAVTAIIYRKGLKLSNSSRRNATVGEIVNLMSVDAQRFFEVTLYSTFLWTTPVQIGIAIYMLWNTLGAAAFAGLAVMILLIPLNGVIASFIRKFQSRQMKEKDQRIKLFNEVLNGIKVMKLYAWETSFIKQIEDVRSKEINILKNAAYLNAFSIFLWNCSPFLVALSTFGTYVSSDDTHILDSTTAFVSLSLFNIIKMPLAIIPMIVGVIVQFVVSLKRVNEFLNKEELDPQCVSHDQNSDPIVIDNGTFSWGSEEEPTLSNVNLQVAAGSLVAIVGTVGSGKSSLVSAMLGEMDKRNGAVNTRGQIAYVPQEAWCRNATLRDNILFGKPYDVAHYNKILEACSLKPDIRVLPGGDTTEIGEKGINLSGGQKQRISIARACYFDADIYLMDDPLSAVDAHVGKHIFDNVIGPEGLLKNKTRVLVTHGITFLNQVDVVVVMKDGNISEIGPYQQLLQKGDAFAEFIANYLQTAGDMSDIERAGIEEIKTTLEKIGSSELLRQISHVSRPSEYSTSGSPPTMSRQNSVAVDAGDLLRQRSLSISSNRTIHLSSLHLDGDIQEIGDERDKSKLTTSEGIETGKVQLGVYLYFLRAGGIIFAIFMLLFIISSQACSIGYNLWLSDWSNDKPTNGTQDIHQRNKRLTVYGVLGLGQGLFSLCGAFCLAILSMTASRYLHSKLLYNILRSPMSFFDTTPLGRIVNRFSRDIDVVDMIIPQTTNSFLGSFFEVLAIVIVICIGMPAFLAVALPLGIVYFFLQRIYIDTARQLKRLESASRSPIYTHFQETVSGVSTIRAYGKQKEFILESEDRVDNNQKSFYPSIISNRWLSVRLELIANLIILATALFAVVFRDSLDPGIVGLTLSYAMSITFTLNWVVRMSSELEANIVAVERIKEYTETPSEAEWDRPDRKTDPRWPSQGVVCFDHYSTRYRPELDLVVKDIQCEIKSGEKIGIVGRTGAGKSSLTLALFRLIEPASGTILIDGVDISQLGLHDLRSKLTIIPQEPVLFSGTLRLNLDPFNQSNDDAIWRALKQSHLHTFAASLPAGLSHEISESGQNLSVGQRQLVCLARALLRKTKVLVLDEATAAVDLETDDLIQQTIRKEFADSTILTIAHRLNTIMDSTRVLVLDKGEIKEFDSPENLLANPKSLFYDMARDAGLV